MSKIEVNAIEPQCGTTLTIGASDTSIAGIGTVNWDTTAKTAAFTAVSGRGYFVNTTSGAITVTLPTSPSAGDIVSLSDYASNWHNNNVTIASALIDGTTGSPVLDTKSQAVTFVYVDGTRGWKTVQDNTSSVTGASFIVATGGDQIITCGDYKTHVFTSPGTFCVSSIGNQPTYQAADYFVIAGGGGGGNYGSCGGGTGGFRIANSLGLPAPTTSPLANPTGITLTATAFPITVGGGGAAGAGQNLPACTVTAAVNGQLGSNSVFSTITSAGGGGGSGVQSAWAPSPIGSGGSGGGSRGSGGTPSTTPGTGYPAGAGNTPPVSPSQGNPGGEGYDGGITSTNGGGGGGAGAPGATTCTQDTGAAGGVGSYFASTVFGTSSGCYGTPGPVGSTRYFAGGGGGGSDGGGARAAVGAAGGAGGGAHGGGRPANTGLTCATVNTGGGGGGGGNLQGPGPHNGSAGASGIVIIRYKYQ